MNNSTKNPSIPRRGFLQLSAVSGAGALTGCAAPAVSFGPQRPVMQYGVQSGDADHNSCVVWSSTDRPGFMHVEASVDQAFSEVIRFAPVLANEESGLAAKCLLTGLPEGREIYYRVYFSALDQPKAKSPTMTGSC
ncbi:MAG: hypothetical protein HN683_04340, partial [Gammaproteobacteria bacterium]|nr:hypothetical protein [Gammaproteobacteria bacterium]